MIVIIVLLASCTTDDRMCKKLAMLRLPVQIDHTFRLTPSYINTAYRMPQKKEKVGKTIARLNVKFVRHSVEKMILYFTRSKNKVSHQQLGLETNGNIFIHEHLSKSQSDLYYKTKDKVKELGYNFVWTQDFNVLCVTTRIPNVS